MYSDEADLCIRIRCCCYECLGTTLTHYFHKVSGTASGISPIAWYFITRNRWLLVIRYFHHLKLIKALILNSIHLLMSLTIRSIQKKWKIRLVIKILRYILKNMRREFTKRRRYSNCWNKIMRFIVHKNRAPSVTDTVIYYIHALEYVINFSE